MKNYRKTVINQCLALRLASWTLLAAYAIGLIAGWLGPVLAGSAAPAPGLGVDLLLQPQLRSSESLGFRLIGLGWGLAAWGAFGWATHALDRLLRGIADGDYFSAQAMARFNTCATALLLGCVLNAAQGTLLPLTHGLLGIDGPARLVLALSLNGSDLWALLLCLVLKVLIHLMHAGARLAREVSEFV